MSKPQAMTRSGTACASAFITAFQAREQASMRARTGAGWRGLSKEPSGASTSIGRIAPSLNGMSGLVSAALMAETVAETVEAKGALRLVRTCGDVPLKSTEMLSPLTVTVARTGNGASLMPSSSTASSPT